MKPTQLPSGSWRCRVFLGKDKQGKPIYKSITRPDYYDCLEEATKLAKHHHESERDNSLLTLREAYDRYIQMKDGILSPSTIRSYDSISRCHLQSIMNKPLKSLSKNIIQAAVNEESKIYSPKTVLNIYRSLTAVLNQYTNEAPKISLRQTEEREANVLTEDQLRTLITELRGDKSEIPLLLALFLGLRRSEAMALTHEDFDQSTNIITINKAKVPNKDGQFVLKTTKSKKGVRKISVPSYLSCRLKEYINANKPFYGVAPERPYKRLQHICEIHGFPRMSMHDLRHQNASIMLSLNIPDKYAMERGGWSSNRVMKQIYQHTMDDQRKQEDSKMNDYFDNLTA